MWTQGSAGRIPDPEELVAWDKAHVWHPFTHMQQYLAEQPLIIRRGLGTKLQDVQGNWYYDGTSSIWVNVHGHNVLDLNAAIEAQLREVAQSTLLGQANVPSMVLARRLVEVAPRGLNRVFYSDCGAAAVEIALKLAVQFWANQGWREKRFILGFVNNYHGDTMGAVGVAPDRLFHWPFLELLPDIPVCCIRTPIEATAAIRSNASGRAWSRSRSFCRNGPPNWRP